MLAETASDFTYEEWLTMLAEKGRGVGEPPTVDGVISVAKFFEGTLMADQLAEHLERFGGLIEEAGDAEAKAELVGLRAQVKHWSHPRVRVTPLTFEYVLRRLHHVENKYPQLPYLAIELAKFEWFIEDFGDNGAKTELRRIRDVASAWGGQ